MTRASGRNEAKIHLGLVYANDKSFRTASLMLDASLAFAPLLEEWLGHALDWQALRSRPFLYGAMRDSLVSFDDLCEFYDRVESAYLERVRESNYVGLRPERLWQLLRRNETPGWVNASELAGLVKTAEVALDLGRLRQELEAGLELAEGITAEYGVRIDGAQRTPSGFRVSGEDRAGERWDREADIVVNCLWEGRLRMDTSMDIRPTRPWVYRLKYRVLGDLTPALRDIDSLTLVLGPYGDIVTHDSAPAYLSWYPACMQGWSDEIAPPEAWNADCEGRSLASRRADIARETLIALDRIIPGVAATAISTVDAGVIFSWGQDHRDVDDPRSELHERHEIGVHAHDGYFSIDTGKFTCAPLFASQLLKALG